MCSRSVQQISVINTIGEIPADKYFSTDPAGKQYCSGISTLASIADDNITSSTTGGDQHRSSRFNMRKSVTPVREFYYQNRRSPDRRHERYDRTSNSARAKSLAPEEDRHRYYSHRSSYPAERSSRDRSRSVGRYHSSSGYSNSYHRRSPPSTRQRSSPYNNRYEDRDRHRRSTYSSGRRTEDHYHERYDSHAPRRTKDHYHERYDSRAPPSSKTTNTKQIFLASNETVFGIMMDREYDVFVIDTKEEDSVVTANSSWTLRMAMYGSQGNMCIVKYLVHRYTASKRFIVNVLNFILKDSTVKVYTTVDTSNIMAKMFGDLEEYVSLKKEIDRLEERNLFDKTILKPQRRSSVCLFRPGCVKRRRCVYCQLEALNNRVNINNGVRATKDTNTEEHDRGVLDTIVNKVAAKNKCRKRESSVSSTSSTSSSSSGSTTTSSSTSSSSSDEKVSKSEDSFTPPPATNNKKHYSPEHKNQGTDVLKKEAVVVLQRLEGGSPNPASRPKIRRPPVSERKKSKVQHERTDTTDVLDLDDNSDIEDKERG